MLDIIKVEKEAKEELLKEKYAKVKDELVAKYKELETARKVVRNIEDEIERIKENAGD